MEQDVLEGNKIVVKDRNILKLVEVFMGYADGYLSEIITWNDVMPVIEKIEKMGYKTVLAEWGYKYYQNIITGVGIIKETIDNPSKFMGQSDSKIEAVWLAVVEFIKWYNKQTKK